ncbi:unnamed protein product [Sphagnum jensenii]|uniref:Uncharacterized protein n=1 Tax=Sphagnum jensenii TaxID=128206 RepID=A0ABP0W6S9_9BRYO
MSLCEPTNVPVSDFDTDVDDDSDGGLQSVEPIDDKSEFESIEIEKLVLKDRPQQILQLTLQDQADDFMREEITDTNDYADWIQWVSDAEKGRQASMEAVRCAEVPALLQINQDFSFKILHRPGGIFSVRHGEESEWFGLKRHSGGLTEHHRCCFGINHWRKSEGHQLFMLDVLAEASQDEEGNSPEDEEEAADREEVRNSGSPKSKWVPKEGRTRYYDR